MKRFWILLVLLASLSLSVFAQERYVRPVDEASLDASFLAFRTKLIAAAERRDVKYLLSVVDPNIKLGFGGSDGIAEFKRSWKINDKNSRFWDEFLRVIKNGGAFDGTRNKKFSSFMAPYTFASWPADIDGFEYLVIFGKDVNLREAPSAEAKIVDRLSYNVVKTNFEESVKSKTAPEDEGEYEWVKVETLGGKKGFVKGEFVRSHIDYRAGFEKQRGVWKLVFFAAGD